ncbi:hypothetical protein BSKO_13319 [Bryopsis sp. KO-2023]|nr:hypothetical protein BSKO_13319 [Bryopsis sp. KO-2023]
MKGKMRRGCGGPCNHCGRTSSPCWRKGPVEKPVLCNACGARFLVKRSLEGYMPGQKQQRAGTRANVGTEVGGISSRSTVERRTLNSRSFSRPILSHQDTKKNEDPSRYFGLKGLMADAMSLSAGDIDVSVAPVFGAFCRGEHGKPSEEEYLEGLAHIAASTLAMLRQSTQQTLDGALCYRQGADVTPQDQPMLDRN